MRSTVNMCIKKLVKFDCVVSEKYELTDKQTGHTDTLITILCTPPEGKITKLLHGPSSTGLSLIHI